MKTYASRTWVEGDTIFFNPLNKKENALFRWINEDGTIEVERLPHKHFYNPAVHFLIPEELLW